MKLNKYIQVSQVKRSSSGGWCQPVESLLYCFDLFIV